MNPDVLLATAAAVVALYAACLHAWVFALQRRAHDHAWAALTGAGAFLVCWGMVNLLDAPDAFTAFRAQQIQSIGAPLVTLGALGFTTTRLRVDVPRLLRAGVIVTSTVLALALVAPELLFRMDATPNTTLTVGRPLLHLELTALGAVGLAMLLPFFFAPIVLCVRARNTGQGDAKALLFVISLWTATGCSDTLVGIGVFDFPFLNAMGGYMALAVAFSAILLRDLAHTRDASERLGASLEEEERARVDALRAIDLRLARGEQLAAIGTLAAGVAHEINNPLAYVSTNLNQLRALWEDASDTDEVKEILAECREGLGRVGTIVADLRRMSHDGESEGELCDLAGVIRDVLPLVLREAGPLVEVVTQADETLPVRGNARLLGQVALNLALNAIHAMPATPSHRPRIELSARARDDGAELSVRDNGPGIPPDVMGEIFEPSFTTRPEGGGTGLGLALTRLVVTRYGGTIDVRSDAGGTAVTVRLPLAARQRTAA
jgi:signal transduction histidine kinase/multisubunit Na+/H+ antiporter MnhG subunit